MAFVQNTLSNLPVTSGSVFFVDSGSDRASDGNRGRDPNVPMATLDAAVARCTANNGDIIVLMPGHAENLTASVALDVNGIWVYGIGWGASRPTFTYTGTGGVITLSGNSVRLTNVRCVPGIASVTAAINLTGDDCIIEECETVIHATSEFLSLVIVGAATATCERNTIRNNMLRTLEAAGATSGILMSGADELLIEGNTIMGHFGEHALDGTTAASVDETLNVIVKGNTIMNYSDTGMAVDLDDNATGAVLDNRIYTGLDFEAGCDFGATMNWENYVTDLVDVSGVILPSAVAAS
jgi:hypothetical protein